MHSSNAAMQHAGSAAKAHVTTRRSGAFRPTGDGEYDEKDNPGCLGRSEPWHGRSVRTGLASRYQAASLWLTCVPQSVITNRDDVLVNGGCLLRQGNRTSISLDGGIGYCPTRTESSRPLGVRNSPGRVRWIGLWQLGKDLMTQGPATPVYMISTSC
jgi:hypothetical protein